MGRKGAFSYLKNALATGVSVAAIAFTRASEQTGKLNWHSPFTL
jgi:hypothetical protein